MKLFIPKDRAIRILNNRIQELSAYGFDPKAWKDRTVLDLKEIFGNISDQSFQISFVDFNGFKTLQQGIHTARQLITSYIEYIEDYSDIRDPGFESQYNDLLKQWNDLVPRFNELNKRLRLKDDDYQSLTSELEISKKENKRLVENTIQFDNITLGRLWIGIRNLPFSQVIGIVTVIVGLFVGTFSLGRFLERTSANNDLFDLKTENTKLKTEIQNLRNQIEIQSKTQRIDK